MNNGTSIAVDLNKVLLVLFCAYAMSLPFELILEIFFNIRTIFKPFRVLSILIIGVYVLKVFTNGLYIDQNEKPDWILYGVLIYGIVISLIRGITEVFSFPLFYNDLFQVGLHITTFFVFKNTAFTKDNAIQMMKYFLIGVFLNLAYITYNFITMIDAGRQSGFTDNPNYVAFGLVASIIYLILRNNKQQNIRNRFLFSILVLFLVYSLGMAGSRAGLGMFLVAILFIFIFSSIRRKILLVGVSLMIGLFLLPDLLSSSSGLNIILFQRINKRNRTGEIDVRFLIWEGVFRTLEDRGYAGMGIGQFKSHFSKYYAETPHVLITEIVNRGYYLSPHSDYLALLADYGMPGLLCYLGFAIATVVRLFRRVVYPTEDEDELLLRRFSFIFFICILIFGIVTENFQHQLYWFFLMFTTKDFLNPKTAQ